LRREGLVGSVTTEGISNDRFAFSAQTHALHLGLVKLGASAAATTTTAAAAAAAAFGLVAILFNEVHQPVSQLRRYASSIRHNSAEAAGTCLGKVVLS
jgi:hypothetical protein